MDYGNIHGYTLLEEWKIANISDTNKGTRGDKKYFLKRYTKCKKPIKSEGISEKGFERQMNRFNEFKDYRTEINKTLRSISGEGGNIIAPREEFVEDIYFMEATEFVPGLLEPETIYSLSKPDVLFAMLTIAGSLHSIHRKKIVHSDLKLSNIAVAKNDSGRYVGKILDFDMSYFADKIPDPDHIGGDANYLSPELAACFVMEFDDPFLAALSTKSDIFSLGLVFHNYLTKGKLPKLIDIPDSMKASKGDGVIYCGEGVASGAKLVIDSKIAEPYLTHLIAAMLQLEPEDRPDANTVTMVLKMKNVLPLKAGSNVVIDGETPITPDPVEPSGTDKPGRICKPWEEHHIVFDVDAILKSGFVCVRRAERMGIKCYEFEKAGGRTCIYKDAQVKMMKWAYKEDEVPERTRTDDTGDAPRRPEPPKETEPVKTPEPPKGPDVDVIYDDNLWEKDSEYCYDMDAIKKSGFDKVGRTKKGTNEVYLLESSSGKQKLMSLNNLKMLGLVKKK